MKGMKLIWHIARKDFRHLRFYLAGWWGLLIVAPIVVPIDFRLDMGSIFLIGILKIVLLALIVSSLVHSDSVVGSTSFWLSRPVSARQLLVGKALFLAETLIFPTLLVEVVILLFNGVTARDILASIPEILFYTLLAIAILMMLAALTRSLLEMLAFGLVCVVVMTVFAYVIAVVGDSIFGKSMPIDPMARMTLQSSKWIGFFLCLMVMAVIMVCVQYLTRRSNVNVIVTLLALFPCILLSMNLWTWDLVASVRNLEGTIVDPEKITARIDQQSFKLLPMASTSLRDRRLVLHGNILVENHPPGLIVVPIQVVSNVSFGSETVGFSEYDVNEYEDDLLRNGISDFGESDLDDGRVEVLEEALGDVRLLVDKSRLVPGYVPKFLEIPEENYDGKSASPGKLSAQVYFLTQRVEITPLAMGEGARYRRGSDHAEFLGVTHKGKRVMFIDLKESNHRLFSDRPKYRWYALLNHSREEALIGEEVSSNFFGGVRFILPTVNSNHLQLHFTLPFNDPAYGPDWFEGAELVRIDITYLDSFSRTIRLENLVMKDIPGP